MRALLPLLLLGLSLPASAASRLVFQLSAPVDVTVDGRIVTPSGNRAVANGVSPGRHQVQVRVGDAVHTTAIDVDDGQSVDILVTGDGRLSVRGSGARIAPSDGSTARSSATLDAAAASDPQAVDPGTGSFDMNEGSGGGAAPDPNRPAGNYQAFATGVATAGRVAGGVVAPGATAVAGVAAPAVARGATSMVRNAKAGGVGDLRSGPAQGRQGTARPPKTVTGTVNFQTADGDGYIIYIGGMEVARVGPGASGSAKVPVGRQPVELWDADTGAVRWRGVLQVEQTQPITLQLSDAAPPQAVERSWAWSNR